MKKAIIGTALVVLIVVGIHEATRSVAKEKLRHSEVCIGRVVKKLYQHNRSSAVNIEYTTLNGRSNKIKLSMSTKATKILPIGYPFLVEYARSDSKYNRIVSYEFPDSLKKKLNSTSVGEVFDIQKKMKFDIYMNFKGHWEIFYVYSAGGYTINGVKLSRENPSVEIGDQFYVKYNNQSPDISYIDFKNPYDEQDILDQLNRISDSILATDFVKRPISRPSYQVIEGDSVQIIDLKYDSH